MAICFWKVMEKKQETKKAQIKAKNRGGKGMKNKGRARKENKRKGRRTIKEKKRRSPYRSEKMSFQIC